MRQFITCTRGSLFKPILYSSDLYLNTTIQTCYIHLLATIHGTHKLIDLNSERKENRDIKTKMQEAQARVDEYGN